MRPSLSVFTSGFNTTLLQHTAVAKCVNGRPKIIPDVGLVAEVKLHFPGLHDHLTSLLAPEESAPERERRVDFKLFQVK
jgi:hypothetical protein